MLESFILLVHLFFVWRNGEKKIKGDNKEIILQKSQELRCFEMANCRLLDGCGIQHMAGVQSLMLYCCGAKQLRFAAGGRGGGEIQDRFGRVL